MAPVSDFTFEEADLAAFESATGWGHTGTNIELSTAQFHDGAKSLRSYPSGYSDAAVDSSTTAKAQKWFGAWIRVHAVADSPRAIHYSDVSTGDFVALVLNTNRTLMMMGPNMGATLIAATTTALTLDTWYWVQWTYKPAGTSSFWEIIIGAETKNSTTNLSSGNLTSESVGIADGSYGGGGEVFVDHYMSDDATYPAETPPPSGVFLRPISDDTDGGWTDQADGTTLYAAIDEVTADDADYIKSEVDPATDVCILNLDSMTNPPEAGDIVLRYRYKKTGVNQVDLVVGLYDNTTLIEQWTHNDISGSWTTAEQTLTETIPSYSNLKLKFSANKP